jgi:hypothetical protein
MIDCGERAPARDAAFDHHLSVSLARTNEPVICPQIYLRFTGLSIGAARTWRTISSKTAHAIAAVQRVTLSPKSLKTPMPTHEQIRPADETQLVGAAAETARIAIRRHHFTPSSLARAATLHIPQPPSAPRQGRAQ